MATSDTQLIPAVPLSKGLDRKALADAQSNARIVRAGGSRLLPRRGACASLLRAAAGRVKFTQITPEGHEIILHLIGPGEPFGGVAASSRTRSTRHRPTLELGEAYAWDVRSCWA